MKRIADLIQALFLAGSTIALALISVQNARPVSLTLLGLRSIELPFGLLLALAFAAGVLAAALLPWLWPGSVAKRR